jgi:hypothetical protein
MRKSFTGYYPPTERELKQIWDNGIIVLDTNVLLNLYRYSREAREALLELITNLQGRLWLPHQIGLEYHRQRLERIYAERKNCDTFVSEFRQLLKNLDESRRHPFVNPEFRKKLDDVATALESEIKPAADELDKYKRNDPILDLLTKLYEGKVGSEPDSATRDGWLAEGEDRFRRGTPPGFEDRRKTDERKFGDLILWKETLVYAGEKKTPVMFVTDDSKKDWWREQSGETVGPHPSLVAEMVAASGQPFHMYRPERFVEFGGKHVAKPVPSTVLEEVKKARQADEIRAGVTAAESQHALLSGWSLSIAEALKQPSALERAMKQQSAFEEAMKQAMKHRLALDQAMQRSAFEEAMKHQSALEQAMKQWGTQVEVKQSALGHPLKSAAPMNDSQQSGTGPNSSGASKPRRPASRPEEQPETGGPKTEP